MPLAADLAADPDGGGSAPRVAPDPGDLAPFEQVGEVAGVGPVHIQASQVDADPAERGAGELGVKRADVALDVLVGADVLAGPAARAADAIEEPGVDINADAEGEDPRPCLVGVLRVLGDLEFGGLARGGQTIGEEEDVAGARVVGDLAKRGPQSTVDVGPAAGSDVLDEAGGFEPRLLRVALEFGLVGIDVLIVHDDVEGVVVAEIVEDELERRLGLVELLARHRPRAIQHEHHGLGQRFALGRLHAGAGQEEEVAVLAVAGAVAQERRPDCAVAQGIDQAEVGGGQGVFQMQRRGRLALVGAVDPEVLAGAIDRLDGTRAEDADVEVELADRFARLLLRGEGEQELHHVAVAAADLVVFQGDDAVRAGRDRKNASLVETAPHVLQERRVALAADDRLVDGSSLGLGEDPTG